MMESLLEWLKLFFTEPSWLLPTAVSVVMQLVGTHHLKAFLPLAWMEQKRDAVIWLLSCVIGVSVFVPTRWAWLTIAEQPFTVAHFVLSIMIALLVIGSMPWIYSKLPAEFRQQYSYQRKLEQRE